MSEFNTNTKNHTPRVLRIWLPSRKAGWLALVILAIGIFISYSLALAFFGLVISIIFKLLNISAPGALITITIFMSAIGPYYWIRFYNQWQHRERMMLTSHRGVRLANIFTGYKTIGRLPHRYIEHVVRQRPSYRKKIKQALLTMSPGMVIVANGPKLVEQSRLQPNDIPFEPIDLREDKEQADWLVTANYESQIDDFKKNMPKDEEPAEGSPRHLYQQARHGLSRLVAVTGWIFLIWMIVDNNNSMPMRVLMSCSILWIVAALFARTLAERRWWLVPAGLFYREHRFWKKELKVKILRATDTPLFLNLELNQAMVVDDGKVRMISIYPSMGLAILAGWISSARTPTDEEIHSFVGITNNPRPDETKQ